MDYLTEVAEFAAGYPAADVPREVVERTRLIIADSIGAIVGGAAEPEVRALSARPGMAGGGPALLIGTATGAHPAQAALVNGTAGTWLEMDEGNQFCKGHPGMHTFPAAFAVAEARGEAGGASGLDFLAAVAVGYEIGARVGISTSLRPSMHPHGTWGTICAAVAVQRLAGADGARMREALNIAANLTLGTSRRTMLEGGTVRNLFAGVSGQMGVLTDDMIEAGFCGELDGVAQVFGKVVSDSFDQAAMTEALGQRWEVMRNYFKMHSCCRYNHAALDALAMIAEANPGLLDPARIERVEVESYGFAAELDDPRPRNVLAAKFSLPFAVATTLVNGSSGVGSFSGRSVTDPEILALAARVTVREDPAMSAQLPDRRPARVTVTLTDGAALTAETETNRGDWADPYPPAEIRDKYLSLTARLWPASAATAVWDEIMALETRADIAGLGALMRRAAA
ncbi:MAG: MmgE/PrpD family protein [Proteobacteria bacterium]|nr:MmgE/PrpD family protein [Pseudomonadota bacterium]